MTTPLAKRNLMIDQIKAILIFLVVFGHLIEIFVQDKPILKSIWLYIYSFHMPMFAWISGAFSRKKHDDAYFNSNIIKVLVPLIAFEILYECVEYLVSGKLSSYARVFAPYWMLWYLLSLFVWRLLLPIFARVQFPVLASIVLALVVSHSEHSGYFLGISRTLNFLPFFLLGHFWGIRYFSFPSKFSLFASIFICASSLYFFYMYGSEFDHRLLYGSYSLQSLGRANLQGMFFQITYYAFACIIGLASLNLFSRVKLDAGEIGRRSLYVLVWHGILLIGLHQLGILLWIFSQSELIAGGLALFVSLIIVFISTRYWTVLLTDKLILNPLAWLIVRQELNGFALKISKESR